MEKLPLELMQALAKDLTPQELAACCAVSVDWRNAFNQDSLWSPHCNKDTAEYLETAECRVEPRFESPESEDSTLSPVCYWRMCYMREIHLENNWRRWKSITDYIPVKNIHHMYTFVSNDFVIITRRSSHESHQADASLWDVRNLPVSLGNPFRLLFCEGDIIMVSDKCLLVVQMFHVEVYNCESSCDSKWTIRYFFFVDGTETYLSDDRDKIQTNDKVHDRIKSHYLTGRYFVYVTNKNSDIHVWDINEGKELSRVTCPINGELVPTNVMNYRIIKPEKDSKDFVIVLSGLIENTVANIFHVYSLNRLEFLPFQVRHDFLYCNVGCVLIDQFIAVANVHGPVHIYNYMTSELIVEVSTTSSDILAFGNNILICEQERIHAKFNCRTSRVETLRVANLNESTSKYRFMGHLFDRFFYTISTRYVPDLWEIGKGSKSDHVRWITRNMYMLQSYKINKSHTKLVLKCVVHGSLLFKVINFW